MPSVLKLNRVNTECFLPWTLYKVAKKEEKKFKVFLKFFFAVLLFKLFIFPFRKKVPHNILHQLVL